MREVNMLLKRRKTVRRSVHSSEALLFVLGATISVLFPEILVAVVSGSPWVLFILFVCSSLGAMLGFALYILKIRSFQQRETFRLVKTQHKEFFQHIRSNVTHLLEKA